jgi:hypothetical protein
MLHKVNAPRNFPSRPMKLFRGTLEQAQRAHPNQVIWYYTSSMKKNWTIIMVEVE